MFRKHGRSRRASLRTWSLESLEGRRMLDASQIAFPGLVIPPADEMVGEVPLTVVRTGDLSGPASVRVRTESNDAVAGLDYVPLDFVLNFAPGQDQATFSVGIIDDDVSEPLSKSIGVRLSDPVGADLGFWSVVGFQLNDNEEASYSTLAFLDFGDAGLWTYNDVEGYRKINDLAPESIVATSDRGAYLDYGPAGLWEWNALEGYRKISDVDPKSIVRLPTENAPRPQFATLPTWDEPTAVIDFGHGGLWALGETSGNWWKINDVSPDKMAGDGYAVLLDYGTQGLWRWESFFGGWTKLNDASPENMVGGNGLRPAYFDFGASGLWSLQSGTWQKMSDDNPEAIADGQGLLYVDMGPKGFWMVDGVGRFHRLSEADPRSMTATEAGVFVDFGDAGLWQYVPTFERWTSLNERTPVSLATDGLGRAYLNFGDQGLWHWDSVAGYLKINDAAPRRIVAR